VDQSDLCNSQGVTGYPTLKVFRHGVPTDYGGPRKADGIISYMVKQSLPAVAPVSAADHAEFTDADKVVIVAYLASPTDAPVSAFSAVAEEYREDYLFGLTTDEKAIEAAGVVPPAIVLYKQFDEGRDDFYPTGIKDTTKDVLAKWVSDNAIPLLDEINGENYPSYSSSGLPLAYLFLDPEAEGKEAYIDAIKPISKKYKGKINFVWIDAVRFVDHAKSLNLKTDSWPGFVIQDIKSGGLKYPLEGTPSFATVDEFVTKYVSGKLEPSLKSQDVPETNDGPVTVVVGKQFDQILNDQAQDVFVEFYAPWCGHCKRLAPTWEELGERFSDVKDKIVIAKMDATENDIPPSASFKVSGFPTLKFRAAGTTEFVDYSGDRTLDSLVAFAEQNAKNNLTPPPKVEKEPEHTSSQISPTESAEVDTSRDHVEL